MELNGEPASAEDIAPLTLYNYGNYTTMLVRGGGVRGLNLHLERLDKGALLLFGQGIDRARVRQLIRQSVANQSDDATIVRATVFCKDFDLAHPGRTAKLDILVTTRPAPTHTSAISLKSIQYQRDLAEHKTASVGGALYRRRLAQQAGFDDALFINDNQEISEGPMWNVGFMKGDTCIFPTASRLPGVSMTLLLQALKTAQVPVQVRTVRMQDVADMDFVFVLSAGSGIRRIKAIDKQTFPETGKLNMLREIYEAIPYDKL